jgi:branched-chain amino acid aminotransferase
MEQMKLTKIEKTRIDKIDFANLGFGRYFSDHMYWQKYEGGRWLEPEIVPYAPIQMYPSNITLHYGQSIFEGQKAFYGIDGKIRLFRPEMHVTRINNSARRMCIPEVSGEDYLNGLEELVCLDKAFVPKDWGTSLYIRPFIFGTDDLIGVKVSDRYSFFIITSPVASYYEEGLNPIKIKVCSEYSRVVKGGLGEVKAAANYAASLYAAYEAKKAGFAQVLWLDGKDHKYVDEVGTMNIMFVIDGVLITPKLEGTILPGITRDCVLQIARAENWKVEERQVEFQEIIDAHDKGTLEEVFGTGTAAIISPVGELVHKGKSMVVNDRKIGKLSQMLYDRITGIQHGKLEDSFHWTKIIC